MTRHWVTNASPTVEGVVNPVMAACEQGFVPEEVPPGLKQLLMSPFHGRESEAVTVQGDESEGDILTVRIEQDKGGEGRERHPD